MQLKAGQNTPLTGDVIGFSARADTAFEVSALVVGDNLRVRDVADHVCADRPSTSGVALLGDRVEIALDRVRADAKAVLLVVGAPADAGLGRVTVSLSESGRDTVEFAVSPTDGETALICLEVYRRGPDWKVRAVGQGYAGGLAVLLAAHGVEVDGATDPPPDHGRDTISGPQRGAHAQAAPVEVAHGLERLWMIFEDAARSAAALISARDYAADRLDNELSASVADPATRNTPAAEAARREAQRRSEELIATAESNHRRDSEHLMRELADSDRKLPAALASWNSPAWDGPPRPSDGIRLGELYAVERGPLRVPYCVPVPMTRPLWIDTDTSAAVVPVVGALLARLLVADPARRTRMDVIDLTGAFTSLLAPLGAVLNGPVVTDHADISPRLQALVDAAEIAEIAYSSGNFVPPDMHRVLLAADFPHGYQASDALRIGSLITRGDLIGLSMVIVGTDESESADSTVATLSQSCRHLPTVEDTPLFDPWTGSAWQLELDLLPLDPERRARLLR
ncbi:TerD family protein [Nocardia arizonensis]|uniref:TerD family protein n=1 Tax=Nocardia arizonensis TaxID=1141647 RepID=UPI000ADA2F7A|nr:TerD family protein [Nocardia arizonensis]